jgi:hypothetical protein
MDRLDIEAVLRDPEASPWLRAALASALNCDPLDAAADAAWLQQLLDRRLTETLRSEIRAESGASERSDSRPAAA